MNSRHSEWIVSRHERGYAMIALLVAMSVMAVMLGVALPSWRTFVQREKEAELVFRGEQYARAITLFQRKYANASPPNLDVLVTERFLRKLYKDPITGDDFQIVAAGGALPGDTGTPDTRTPAGMSQALGQLQQQIQQQAQQAQQARQGGAGAAGRAGGGGIGIMGVTSKSPEKSFRLYRGRDTYNQWVFMGVQQTARVGGPGGRAGETGRGGRDGRGGPQQPPGGRGTPPQQPAPGRGFGGRNFEN